MDRNFNVIFEALLSVLILVEILFLAIGSIGFLIGIKSSTVYTLGFLDLIVSLLILFDFIFFRIIRENNKNIWKFLGENWVYIIASIPLFFISFNLFQLFGFKIIIGLIGIIRIYALIKVFLTTSREVRKYPQKTKLDYATIVLFLVLILGSALFFIIERTVNPEVPNYESAIWYAIVSMTTTGYGDIVPVTLGGHILGVLFILTGMGYISLTTATLAYTFIDIFRKESQKRSEKVSNRLAKTSEGLKASLDSHDEKIDKVLKRMNDLEEKLEEKKN
ncbi:MAG: potassium channel family protein [Methanobacterium sp.]